MTSDARAGARALSKERGTLAKVAISYGRYLELGRQIAEAEEVEQTRERPRDAVVCRG